MMAIQRGFQLNLIQANNKIYCGLIKKVSTKKKVYSKSFKCIQVCGLLELEGLKRTIVNHFYKGGRGISYR